MSKSTWGQPNYKTITPKKPRKFLSHTKKSSGQLAMFKEIMQEKMIKGKLYSEVSGEEITTITHKNFHHLLPKGNFPLFKLHKPNIIVITDQEHDDIHLDIDKLRKNPKWEWVWEKIQELKDEYKKVAA